MLVDLGNLVSVRYGLPVAVFDQRSVTGSTTVRFAEGGESFTDLGGDGSVSRPEPGEAIFVDDAGLVSARRWCWRQSAESAARAETTEILVTVEGHHEGAAEDVANAVEDLRGLLDRHAGEPEIAAAVLMPVTAGVRGNRGGDDVLDRDALRGRVAVVAGATRGAGRGIAAALGEAGATVYCTGRSSRGGALRSDYDRAETIEETAELVTDLGGTVSRSRSTISIRIR